MPSSCLFFADIIATCFAFSSYISLARARSSAISRSFTLCMLSSRTEAGTLQQEYIQVFSFICFTNLFDRLYAA